MSQLKPIGGTLAGVAFGLAYYKLIGCTTGTCWISGDPFLSGGYWGFAGFFLGGGIRWVHAARELVERRFAG
ncbi:MAG: hypothetical protein EP330_29335 [Deltaproteobacteria bacterium]|nr:MAG: hypothetical protein EP330_29335 [Deltaproteobacteria bacterium]